MHTSLRNSWALSPQERRAERDGWLLVLYAARIGDCRDCLVRAQCQENLLTIKPRRVSAVFWPISSSQVLTSASILAPPDSFFLYTGRPRDSPLFPIRPLFL